ncbi:MAG: trypsin-like peptidase domain-containing protein [Bacteriovoracaceae bacterium]|nr:trypsin-like peptidase domain-containing protein [Bacteriovoracaceae bacterium]
MFRPLKVYVILLLTTSTIAGNAASSVAPKVIYGTDDRYLLHEYPNEEIRRLARSTAAMIHKGRLKNKIGSRVYLQDLDTLQDSFNICPDEKFTKELVAAECSGSLIAPGLILTAAHCVKSNANCSGSKWVFDFRADKVNSKTKYVEDKNIYSCKRIISSSYFPEEEIDYTIIELDRKVTDRMPLPVRMEGVVPENAELVIIGHPSGLPTIIADNGYVLDNDSKNIFKTNLDTFSINSGSAVINKATGVIEGVLIRGQKDYEWDKYRSCLRPNFWKDPDFPGESVIRTTTIQSLAKIIRDFN